MFWTYLQGNHQRTPDLFCEEKLEVKAAPVVQRDAVKKVKTISTIDMFM
jgi:hypothetical protein